MTNYTACWSLLWKYVIIYVIYTVKLLYPLKCPLSPIKLTNWKACGNPKGNAWWQKRFMCFKKQMNTVWTSEYSFIIKERKEFLIFGDQAKEATSIKEHGNTTWDFATFLKITSHHKMSCFNVTLTYVKCLFLELVFSLKALCKLQ